MNSGDRIYINTQISLAECSLPYINWVPQKLGLLSGIVNHGVYEFQSNMVWCMGVKANVSVTENKSIANRHSYHLTISLQS